MIVNTAALNNRPRGIRKLSELNIQDGRTVIFTEEDAEKLNWSDIPVGSLKVHKETGMISVKLEGESYWVPAGIKNTAEVTRTFFFETWNPTKFYNIGDVVVNPDDHTVYTRIQISDIADKPITSNIFNVKSGEKVSTLPTAPANNAIAPCANTFMGWSTHNLGSETGQGDPGDLFTTIEGSPVITQNTIFYAVFATKQNGN